MIVRCFILIVFFCISFSFTSGSDSLPQGWEKHISPDMRPYYFNRRLDVSQWTKPQEIKDTIIALSPGEMEGTSTTPAVGGSAMGGSMDTSGKYSHIKIQKFFLRATEIPNSGAISLALQMDFGRIGRLEKHIKRWNGPVSAAILVHASKMNEVKRYIDSMSPDLKKKVTVHLCVSTIKWKHYPINLMRNIAMNEISTAWTFVLDSDEDTVFPMVVYKDEINRAIESHSGLNLAKVAFAVTSWQWSTDKKGEYPTSRSSLRTLYATNRVDTKAPHFPLAYVPPSVPRQKWLGMESATFTSFVDNYEPYYIVRTGAPPKFDIRFRGWGANKSVQTLEMALEKFQFLVLPRVFTFVDDTPQQAQEHSPPADPQIIDSAWKELGQKYGCGSCALWVCISACPWLVQDIPKPSSTSAALTPSSDTNNGNPISQIIDFKDDSQKEKGNELSLKDVNSQSILSQPEKQEVRVVGEDTTQIKSPVGLIESIKLAEVLKVNQDSKGTQTQEQPAQQVQQPTQEQPAQQVQQPQVQPQVQPQEQPQAQPQVQPQEQPQVQPQVQQQPQPAVVVQQEQAKPQQ